MRRKWVKLGVAVNVEDDFLREVELVGISFILNRYDGDVLRYIQPLIDGGSAIFYDIPSLVEWEVFSGAYRIALPDLLNVPYRVNVIGKVNVLLKDVNGGKVFADGELLILKSRSGKFKALISEIRCGGRKFSLIIKRYTNHVKVVVVHSPIINIFPRSEVINTASPTNKSVENRDESTGKSSTKKQ